jgi:hypothetical protein
MMKDHAEHPGVNSAILIQRYKDPKAHEQSSIAAKKQWARQRGDIPDDRTERQIQLNTMRYARQKAKRQAKRLLQSN